MKRLVMTLALTCVLSISAMAGDIHNVDSPAPAPSPTPQGISASPSQLLAAPGDMSTVDSAQPVDSGLSALLWVFGLVI
jgi:hypothetical protein